MVNEPSGNVLAYALGDVLQIKETREEFTIEALMPILGLPRFIETFKKDGSIIELNARRDSRKGKAYGQALALSDGKIVTR